MVTLDDWIEATTGVSDGRVAELCRVHRTTVRRWRAIGVPYLARRVLRCELAGELPAVAGSNWRGWCFGHDALLYAPDLKRGFSAGDLHELHWLQQTAAWRAARVMQAESVHAERVLNARG